MLIGLLSLLLFLHFHPLLQGYVLFGEDISFQNVPQRLLSARLLRGGEIPLWIPHIFAGFPLHAEGQTGVFYPPQILLLLAENPLIVYHLLILIHLALGGVGFYLLTGRYTCALPAALAGAGFAYVLLSQVQFINMLATFSLTPWMIHAGLSYVRRPSRPRWVVLALLSGLQFLTLHLQASFLALLLCLFFYLLDLRSLPRRGPLFFSAVAALGAGALVGALQLLPHAELIGLSVRREALPNAGASLWRVAGPKDLLLSLVGGVLALVKGGEPTGFGFGASRTTYLLIFAASLFTLRGHTKDRRFLWGLFIVSLLLAAGNATPFYRIASGLLPLLKWMRAPDRFLALWGNVALLLLFAAGLKRCLHGRPRLLYGAAALLALLFAFDAYRSPVSVRNESYVTLALNDYKAAQAFAEGKEINRLFWVPPSLYTTPPKLVRRMQQEKGLFRLVGIGAHPFHMNANLIFDLHKLDGYSPLAPARFFHPQGPVDQMLETMNVRFVVSDEPIEKPLWKLLDREEGVYLYRHDDPLPRAFMMGRGRARIAVYGNQRVVVETSADQPDFLVLSDHFYPGWEAEVDGRAGSITPVAGYFRGVELPAGKHRVVFRYRPRTFHFGYGLSFLTLCALTGILLGPRRTRNRR